MPDYIYPEDLQEKIIAYYERYYRSCGLGDFKERTRRRLKEEQRDEGIAKFIQTVTNFRFAPGQKHLNVGAGTGGMSMVLKKNYNCDVYGVEPSQVELEIIHQKCKVLGIPPENFKLEGAEEMSFPDNTFDFVHCYTVLEHVQDVERSILEMMRVTKPGGYIHIKTPNYNFPYEGHYKMVAPTFLPKIFTKLWFAALGKPTKFLNNINFLRPHQLNTFLDRQGWTWYRIYQGEEKAPLYKVRVLRSVANSIQHFFRRKLFIYPQQELIIRKL